MLGEVLVNSFIVFARCSPPASHQALQGQSKQDAVVVVSVSCINSLNSASDPQTCPAATCWGFTEVLPLFIFNPEASGTSLLALQRASLSMPRFTRQPLHGIVDSSLVGTVSGLESEVSIPGDRIAGDGFSRNSHAKNHAGAVEAVC